MIRDISLQLNWMTQYGPRSLCQTAQNACVFTRCPGQHPTPQPKQMEMPPEPEHVDIDIPVEIPDLIDVPEELLSDFDSWTHSILEYQW